MKFESLLARLPPTGLFRSGEILAGERDPKTVRRQLDRWVKSGKIVQLRREVYLLQKPYCAIPPHSFMAANFLRRASYVSLQSALSYYGMIPEHVPVVTSITGGRPEEVDTPIGRFLFRHVQSRLFFGFVEKEIAPGQTVLIATPEKALADLLYLTPGCDERAYVAELRVERPEPFHPDAFMDVVKRMQSPKVERAITILFDYWEEEALYETTLD
jgi:predicted transcriptional regulator of viral defense system